MRYREVVEGLERSDREIKEELFNEGNVLESKTTQNHHLSLQPSKRLKSHPLFREEPPECKGPLTHDSGARCLPT